MCGIMHLLTSKTPYSAYVSQDVSKNGHLAQANFLVKYAKLAKLDFETIFIKIWIYLESILNKSITSILPK